MTQKRPLVSHFVGARWVAASRENAWTDSPLPAAMLYAMFGSGGMIEGAYLLLIGAWKASHGPLDHIKVALRSGSHLFEIFEHHGSNGKTRHD